MNRRILITRSLSQSSALAQQLAASGFDPIVIPAIEIAAPTSFTELDTSLAKLDTFHWLLFTSANAVEAFANRRTELEATSSKSALKDATANDLTTPKQTDFSPPGTPTGREEASAPQEPSPFSYFLLPTSSSPTPYSLLPTPCRIAAIGPATQRAIESHGLKVDLLPPQAIAESLTEALFPHAHQPDGTPTRFLFIRAEQARDHLPATLRAAGAEVTIAPAYRTIIPETSIAAIRDLFTDPTHYPDAITFTSSSTATNLLALLEASNLTLPPEIPRISIGPITSQTLRDLNLPPHAESPQPTIPSLAATIIQDLSQDRTST